MKKLLLFAAVAGLGLVSASPPGKGPDNGAREALRHYPPCSRTVRDRCIQLHERGVRAGQHGERHARTADHARPDHHARQEQHARAEDHGGREHHAHGDHRNCPDHHAHADRHAHVAAEQRTARRVVRIAQMQHAAGCRCAQPRRQHAQRVRRAGERG